MFGSTLTSVTRGLETTPRFYQVLTGLVSVTGTLPRGTLVLIASSINPSRVTSLAGLSPVPPRYGEAMFLAGSGHGTAILGWGQFEYSPAVGRGCEGQHSASCGAVFWDH